MRKLLLVFSLIILICQPVAANPIIIAGAGSVELGQGITVTEERDKNGDMNYTFRVKDGEVWRGATLLPISTISADGAAVIKTDALLDQIIKGELTKNTEVISTENAKLVTIGAKECAIATLKFGVPDSGFIANMDMAIISGANGIKMFGYICADSDAPYWRPIMQKIMAKIP